MEITKLRTMAETAQIADVPVATLRWWFQSGLYKLGSNDQAAKAGGTRRLSDNTVLAIAIGAALARLSVPLPRAFEAGGLFAHTSDGNPSRHIPGALYVQGFTMIAVPPDDAPIQIFRITSRSDPLKIITGLGMAGATLLPVNPIAERIGKWP